MIAHQGYVPFIIIQLDLYFPLIGHTAGILYHLQCVHAAASRQLIGSNHHASANHPALAAHFLLKTLG